MALGRWPSIEVDAIILLQAQLGAVPYGREFVGTVFPSLKTPGLFASDSLEPFAIAGDSSPYSDPICGGSDCGVRRIGLQT